MPDRGQGEGQILQKLKNINYTSYELIVYQNMVS